MDLLKKFLNDLKELSKLYLASKWLLRIFVLIYVFVVYGKRFLDPSLESEYFWLALAYSVFSLLLFFGGFSKNSDLTRFAALGLFVASIIHLSASLLIYKKIDELFTTKLLFLGIIIYFLTSSKRQEFPHKRPSSSDGIFDESEDI